REGPEASVDLARGLVWPCLIDVHTHLDKGHTWERAANQDGTFDGAIRAVSADRAARWSAEDVRRRMDFGLRCSWAHGTKAVRTHLDSFGTQAAITWPVFEALRKEWAGRVELQAVSLVQVQTCGSREGTERAHRGSLGVESPDVVTDALHRVAEAAIKVVRLPMCNLYLQDRVPGRTPRWRGVTLLHELASRRVPVAVASDNTRDAFYGFGDHDMLEVFREATRICHLDRPYGDWPRAVPPPPD